MYTAVGRQQTHLKTSPGPADYNPNNHSVSKKGETYKVGSEQRTLLKVTNTNPGPGDHKHDSQFAGPKYTFGAKIYK
jgi:hypothetical protein